LDRKPRVKAKEPARSHRLLEQFETGLRRCPSPFLAIAWTTARDNISPRRRTTPRSRDHMITGQFTRSQLLAAVLAVIFVSSIDVLARELDVSLSEPNEAKQPHDGGHTQTVAHRMYFSIRFLEHLDLLEEDQFQRPFPVDHIQWLKRGIEQ